MILLVGFSDDITKKGVVVLLDLLESVSWQTERGKLQCLDGPKKIVFVPPKSRFAILFMNINIHQGKRT